MLLAVDTSTQWMGVALYDGANVVGEINWNARNHHTVELAATVDNLLNRCGMKPSNLGALAVALGPGSFTGLRIGLAFIKGMALTLHLPVFGIPTLDIITAAVAPQQMPLVAVLQAGRKRLAMRRYESTETGWKAQGETMLGLVEELAATIGDIVLVCGELNEADRQVFKTISPQVILASPAQSARRPSFLAELAWQRWQMGEADDVVSLAPFYLHVEKEMPL